MRSRSMTASVAHSGSMLNSFGPYRSVLVLMCSDTAVVQRTDSIRSRSRGMPKYSVTSLAYDKRHTLSRVLALWSTLEGGQTSPARSVHVSQSHETYGYYAQGVSVTTATLPEGWQDRLVSFETPATAPGRGSCLEPHDLVINKLVAFRARGRIADQRSIARPSEVK